MIVRALVEYSPFITFGGSVPAIDAAIDESAVNDDRWVEALTDIDSVAMHKASDALFELARASHEANELPMEALYAVLGSICSYYYKGEDALAPYGPMMVMSGSRTAIPDDLRDSDLDALKAMLPRIPLPAVRARSADMLWIRRRDHEAAKVAIMAYAEATRERRDHWEHDALEQIERSMQVVSMLRSAARDLLHVPVDAAIEMLAIEPPIPVGYERRLVQALADRRQTDGLEPLLDRAIKRATDAKTVGDHSACQGLYELAATLADALSRASDARQYRIEVAEAWVATANAAVEREDPSFLQAAGLMEIAIKQYRTIGGCQTRVDELHTKMLEWQSHVDDEMKSFSTEIDLSAVAARAVAKVEGKDLPRALVGLAYVNGFRDVGEIRAEVERLIAEHPLKYLFTTSHLDARGRVVARPAIISGGDDETNEAAVRAEMFTQAVSTMGIVAHGGIEPARRVLITEHSVSFRQLLDLLGPSPFIPIGHEPNYIKGLWFGLGGDFATAAQVLAPELEHALRERMVQVGAMLPRLNDDATQEDRMLGEVLHHDRAAEVFGEAKLFTLKAVLVSPFGANLRNRIAHGLLSSSELVSAETVFMWWLALRLAIEPLVDVVDSLHD